MTFLWKILEVRGHSTPLKLREGHLQTMGASKTRAWGVLGD